jgi:hypothetical protein
LSRTGMSTRNFVLTKEITISAGIVIGSTTNRWLYPPLNSTSVV